MKKYKGYELIKAITNGEIKEGTEFLIKNKTKVYYDGRILRYKETYCGIVPNTEIGMSWLTEEFELIEENKEIEKLNDNDTYDYNHVALKINELVRAVNRINKEREEK